MSAPQFQKATRQQVKLKIGVAGPSGSGKTLGALAVAHGLAQGGTVAVIDTERGSASLYADRFTFDTLEIEPPYLSSKYLEAIAAAAEAGYAVVVVDSISHQWDGDGGILQRKEQADCVPGTNHFANWGPFTKEHNEFRSALLNAPIHVIATMRSKMAYAQSSGEGKKGKVEKLGLEPIQRAGMEYEFALVFDVQMDHKADASKDRTDLFTGKRTDLLDPKTGKRLLEWLGSAAPLVPKPAAPPQLTVTTGGSGKAPAAGAVTADTLLPFGKHKGLPLGGLTDDYLAHIVKLGAKLPEAWTEAATAELERRRFQRIDAEEREAEKGKPAGRPMTQADLLEGEGKPPVAVPGDAAESGEEAGDGLPY